MSKARDGIYDAIATERAVKSHLGETKFWKKLLKGIYGPRQGDARIIIDAEDSAKGVGKTGLAVFLAKLLAETFDYEFVEEDMTLSGAQYLQRIQEHPGPEQPSVIILDELAGAGAGHAYREMSTQNVELGNWWQLMRSQRTVTITTLPHWSKASKAMRREAEFRLHCLKEPIGYFKAYEVTTSFGDGDIRTRRLDDERIGFPDMPGRHDEHYEMLAAKKDRLVDNATTDADELAAIDEEEPELGPDEARREEKIEIAQRLREDGYTLREAAEVVDRSHTWVRDHTSVDDE